MRKKMIIIICVILSGGLIVTGVILGQAPQPATPRTKLVSASDTVATVDLNACPILSAGYRGGCASQLQTELNSDDNAGLVVDGFFGAATRTAVISFQQQNGLTADGVVGPATKAALDYPGSVATPQPATTQPSTPQPAASPASPVDCSSVATEGPPSASIPPSQQAYFQCQPPGKPGKPVNAVDCVGGLIGTGLGAAAGVPEALPLAAAALGSLGVGVGLTARAC